MKIFSNALSPQWAMRGFLLCRPEIHDHHSKAIAFYNVYMFKQIIVSDLRIKND